MIVHELGTGDVDPEDTRVCGTDGNTYSSICQLLQETVNVNVHYAGRCNSSHCRGGPVSSIVYTVLVTLFYCDLNWILHKILLVSLYSYLLLYQSVYSVDCI